MRNPITAGLLLIGGWGISQFLGDKGEKEDKKNMKELEGEPGEEGGEGDPAPNKGGDNIDAKLSEGEFVMSKGAVDQIGVDNLEQANAEGGGTNKVTEGSDGTKYASGGGLIKVKGSGNGSTGKLTMHDEKGKQQGGSWDIISGLFGKGGATQKERMDISGTGLPMPDGDFDLHGFEEKKGGWKGLPGLGDWSAFIR